MRSPVIFVLLCGLGLACAGPLAKRLKDLKNLKSIEPVDQKLDQEVAQIGEEALLNEAGENVDRAKKHTTTFCFQINNKQNQVGCDEPRPAPPPAPEPPAEPEHHHEPPPPPAPAPPAVPLDVECEPEIGTFYVQPAGEYVMMPTGKCLSHVPALVHVPSDPSGAVPIGPEGLPIGPGGLSVGPGPIVAPGLAGPGMLPIGPGAHFAAPGAPSVIPVGPASTVPHIHTLSGHGIHIHGLPVHPNMPGSGLIKHQGQGLISGKGLWRPGSSHVVVPQQPCPHHPFHHQAGLHCNCQTQGRDGDELNAAEGMPMFHELPQMMEGKNAPATPSEMDARYGGGAHSGVQQQNQVMYQQQSSVQNGHAGTGMAPGMMPMIPGVGIGTGMPIVAGIPMHASVPMGSMGYPAVMPMMRASQPGEPCLDDSFQSGQMNQGLRLSRGPEEAEVEAVVQEAEAKIEPVEENKKTEEKDEKSSRIVRYVATEKDEASNKVETP